MRHFTKTYLYLPQGPVWYPSMPLLPHYNKKIAFFTIYIYPCTVCLYIIHMFIIHVQITILKPLYIVIWTWIVNIYVLYKDILYMGIYIVKKNIFFIVMG